MSNHDIDALSYSIVAKKVGIEFECLFCGTDCKKYQLRKYRVGSLYAYLNNYYFPDNELYDLDNANLLLKLTQQHYHKVICQICYSNPPDIKEILFKYSMGLL